MDSSLHQLIESWILPPGGSLMGRVTRMIRPAAMVERLGTSRTLIVGDIQYHLGGGQDTAELASLAGISAHDRILDVCCFPGDARRARDYTVRTM